MSRDVRATVEDIRRIPGALDLALVTVIIDVAELGDVRPLDHLTLNIKEARRAP